MTLDPVTSQPYLMKKNNQNTRTFYGFLLFGDSCNCFVLQKKNTCHVPTMLSRELDQEFPLLAFSYISLPAGAFVLDYPSNH